MYLIPSFLIIPLILLIVYWLNNRFEKQQKDDINQLIGPAPKDSLFDAPAVADPKATDFHTTLKPSAHNAQQTAHIDKQQRVAALKAELNRVQHQKQLANQRKQASPTVMQQAAASKEKPLSNRDKANLKKIESLKLQLEKVKQSKTNAKNVSKTAKISENTSSSKIKLK